MKTYRIGIAALGAILALSPPTATFSHAIDSSCSQDIVHLRKHISVFRAPLFKTWLWVYQDWAQQQPSSFLVLQAYGRSKTGRTAQRLRTLTFITGMVGVFVGGKVVIDAIAPKEIGQYLYMAWGAMSGVFLLIFSKYADIYQGALRRISYQNLHTDPLWAHPPVLNPAFRAMFFRDNTASTTYHQYGRGILAQALMITAAYWNHPAWPDEIKVAKVLMQIFRAYQAFSPEVVFEEILREHLFPRNSSTPFNAQAALEYLKATDPEYAQHEILYQEVIRLILVHQDTTNPSS